MGLRRQRTRQSRSGSSGATNLTGDLETLPRPVGHNDASIIEIWSWLYQRRRSCSGTPTEGRSGEPRAHGHPRYALGAVELNSSRPTRPDSSPTPKVRHTTGVKRSLDNQEFFIRLGQKLIKAPTDDLSTCLVAWSRMRLRPYGSAKVLVLSFNALSSTIVTRPRLNATP